MLQLASFVSSVGWSVSPNKTWQSSKRHTVCTLVPETNVTKQRKYRVVPENVREEDRPPLPPTHETVPFIGFFCGMELGILLTPKERQERYGPMYKSTSNDVNQIFLSDYFTIVDILRDPQVFRSKDAFGNFAKVTGNDIVVALDGEQHAESRSVLAPAFSPSLFPYYLERIRERVHSTWERVLANGENIRLAPILQDHYLAITIEMTTGVDMDSKNAARIRELFNKLQGALIDANFGHSLSEGHHAQKQLESILRDVVMENLEKRADVIEKLRQYSDDPVKVGQKGFSNDGVDMLLVSIANSKLSAEKGAENDEEVIAALCRSMVLLWFAGFSTTAVTSMCASFEIGFNQSLHTQLVDEQDKIVAATPNGDKTVTYDQLKSKMPLLDSFLQEILRMRPPGGGAPRKTAYDVEMMGYFVPKGSLIYTDFAVAMSNPSVYPNPCTLEPDRFVKKEGQSKVPPILSFGAPGSIHYCLGAAFSKMVMKATFAILLREYTYTLDPEQSKEYSIIPESIPKSGIVVDKFARR